MTDLVAGAAAAGGRALSTIVSVGGRMRPTGKPLHPHGSVTTGLLHRSGAPERTGVEWLDGSGVDRVHVRVSRGVGLPTALPDVLGLALRLELDSGSADLLFATTGSGRLSRFLLRPSWTMRSGLLTTLLPYRTPTGPRLLAASVLDTAADEFRVELFVAHAARDWLQFAVLEAPAPSREPEPTTAFDPVEHQIPGLAPYRWVTLLREPAYRSARQTR